MRKIFIIYLILAVNSFNCQSKIYAFVGKKISVERVDSNNSFYLKYKNIYKVEQAFDVEIKTDTIVFNSFTHMNQIQYSVYDYAIIYLVKDEEGNFVQKRTYYSPIILNKNGKWYGFEHRDSLDKDYISFQSENLRVIKNLKIAQQVIPDVKNLRILSKAFFPEPFFGFKDQKHVRIKALKSAEILYTDKIKEIFGKKD